jgi:uncharacterized membrane protein
MPDNSVFCPECGNRLSTGLPMVVDGPDRVIAALAYVFLPAIIFLFIEPYKRNRFVRFHCFQAIFLAVVGIVIGIILKIAAAILFLVPLLGPLVVVLAWIAVGLAWFILWIVLILKALQGEMFKLPYIGEMAEKQASSL